MSSNNNDLNTTTNNTLDNYGDIDTGISADTNNSGIPRTPTRVNSQQFQRDQRRKAPASKTVTAFANDLITMINKEDIDKIIETQQEMYVYMCVCVVYLS
eukprot:GEZU01017581.1.p2 GENE.GEZU01017581.1~~GEZU01017581.1.p2  ORF type:complete len:100 (+),score=12.08 GEZU01017581.1:492-791(+)